MFLRSAEGDEWPDLSDDGTEGSVCDDWLAPALADKTSEPSAAELSDAVMQLVPYAQARAARPRSADAFRGADRLADRDRL